MATQLDTKGCEFGRMYALKLANFEETVMKRFDSVDKTNQEILTQNKDLYNHQSSKWPAAAAWSLTAIGTILGIAITIASTKFFS